MSNNYGNLIDFVTQDNFSEDDIIFLTGATGFLGGNFLFWKLQTPGKVFTLVRGRNAEQAKQRIIENLETCAKSYNLPMLSDEIIEKRLQCIVGDLKQDDLGISEEQYNQLSQTKIKEVWHCAASLSFRWEDKEKIDAVNIHGVNRLLSLSKSLNISRFVYVSTAYTAGKKHGLIKEELHPENTEFANYYEASKCEAERIIYHFTQLESMGCTIIRPSIILGPELTRSSGGTRFGLYGFCQEMYQMRDTLAQVKKDLRLVGDKNSVGNFIPVDQVVYDMLYLKFIGFGDQEIYHSCNLSDLKILDAIKQCEKHNQLNCITIVKEREGKVSSFESLFDNKTRFYEGYYGTQKTFERSLPNHKRLTIQDIDNYMRLFVDELKAEEEGSIFERSQISSWDSTPLSVHTLGSPSNSPIIIANAYGMPKDFITPLARRLSKHHFVITWDTRWVPSLTHQFELDKCNSLTHAKDLISIMDHLDIEQAAIIGWSSGVQTCLRTMHEFQNRISSAVLLNGGISLKDEAGIPITQFEENLKSLLPKISSNRRMAEFYCQLIYGNHQAGESDEKAIDSILTSTDPYLLYMTSMPFRSAESLYRYANMMHNLFNEREDAYTTGVETPVLVFGCTDDEVTHPQLAEALCRKLKNSKLVLEQDAGHFAQFYDTNVAIMATTFIQSHLAVTEELV
ncbi:alpha/beta fold hydrolase [Pleionea sediminis]|uniref:alpha/beta fold hydrolase n=1 Tax=Pleionea sediminis TaxID=2569479 RepID=UPI0011859697|nr:alpha/beta fold hydrolase [Pleionea sediminis]